MKRNSAILNTSLVALFVAVLVCCAQICFPLPTGVTVTLQTLGVALCGYALGLKRGVCAVLVYIALGAVGIPVFSAFTNGAAALLSPNGGFIIGFIPLCIVCALTRKLATIKVFLLSILGVALCHVFGILYFCFITKSSLPTALLTASLPFILKDVLSVYIAFYIAKKVERFL